MSDTSVSASITVDVPPERAFHVFTAGIGSWWNPDHHILEAPLKDMVFEQFVGGNIYDLGTDGSECRWSRVLAYEPPERVVFSWDITLQWEIETDPSRTSEVEVTFTPDGPQRTTVRLEHRHLDRHGSGWEQMATAVGTGWQDGVQRFARALS